MSLFNEGHQMLSGGTPHPILGDAMNGLAIASFFGMIALPFWKGGVLWGLVLLPVTAVAGGATAYLLGVWACSIKKGSPGGCT